LQHGKPFSLRRAAGSLPALLATYIHSYLSRSLVIVVAEVRQAETLFEDIRQCSKHGNVLYFPPQPENGVLDHNSRSMRLNALAKMQREEKYIAVFPARSLSEKVPTPTSNNDALFKLHSGEKIDRDDLIEMLSTFSFERVDVVDQMGEYAVRGGIVDVFPWNADRPIRVEFWDDEIESLRYFDLMTQRSVTKLSSVEILGQSDNSDNVNASLFDYTSKAVWWAFEMQVIANQLDDNVDNDDEEGKKSDQSAAGSQIVTELQKKVMIYSGFSGFERLPQIDFEADEAPLFHGNVQKLPGFLLQLSKKWQRLVILAERDEQIERLREIMDDEAEIDNLTFIKLSLEKGFTLNDLRHVYLPYHQIFSQQRRKRTVRRHSSASYLRALRAIKYGDYVVHVDHGIGVYRGMEKIKVRNNLKECVRLEYAEGESLFVYFENLNRLQKYAAETEQPVELHKLGGRRWHRDKDKANRAAEKIAADLVAIYASRLRSKGRVFSPDSKWQRELEASFPYEDTADQIQATIDVKKDMEKAEPMDRLICGDVGFGKTEVAVRAAFKAVQDSFQVAVLVPTTLLASQHFETFRQRLRDFPVRIELLSRFVTPKQQKTVLQGLEKGEVDIVIGTHRLLSEDVAFVNLGLLVVDEEQRFGVKHKEKIKKLRADVDVLSMSATPIPRTLQLSILGVRGLSNIETPPRNRLPVYTEIMPWSDARIAEIIRAELVRQGQVFFVHNRVETIVPMGELVQKIVPEAKVAIAHGQMPERELEKVMGTFTRGLSNVLVASMIIENGIDIPNSNTIIINRADKFGLSQLYQLRGRVGRSDVQAYAYLLTPNPDRLTSVAIKRLHVLTEYAELGAGFKLALRDLEIRGAGNLLGHQQSGNINAVGFDMYVKILNEAIARKQQEDGQRHHKSQPVFPETKLDIDLDLFISENYIANANERMRFYHDLLLVESLPAFADITAEMEDRFGHMPQAMEHFIQAMRIRFIASRLYITRLFLRRNSLQLFFSLDTISAADQSSIRLAEINDSPDLLNIEYKQNEELLLQATLKGLTMPERLSRLEKMLQQALGSKQE
jgi:transcription-repair coupling factor (superfamily II helicase)